VKKALEKYPHTVALAEEVLKIKEKAIPEMANLARQAIAAIEDENDSLAGVLKNNINFNEIKGKTKIPDQKWNPESSIENREFRNRESAWNRKSGIEN